MLATIERGRLGMVEFKSCLVDTERYLLTCYRYIKLNPIRAGMVSRSEDYRWTSYHTHARGEADPVFTLHGEYLHLGPGDVARQATCRILFQEELGEDRSAEIRTYVQQQCAWGSVRFQNQIEATLGRRARVRPAHRPLVGMG